MNNVILGGALILTALVQTQPAKEPSGIPPVPPEKGPVQVQVQGAIQAEALETLFQVKPGLVAGRQPALERGPCNMPVIQAHSNVDPKMVVPIPREKDARIRVIEPTI